MKYELTQDGKHLFTGTENECYYKLQRIQGQSADWAMKYEGYKIKKVIRTNSKQVKQAIQEYIIGCIDTEPYDFDPEILNLKAKLELVTATYREEKHRDKGNLQDLFIEWLQGLPSILNIDFEYYKILELMENEWGLKKPENKTLSDSSELFYKLIYREFLTLCKNHKVDYYRIIDK